MARKPSIENIARRKEQIVRAAITAFARNGLKDTSMDDIVRESGMSKGAIYWYFKSKDDLISQLLNEFFDPGDISRLEAMLSTGSPSQRLEKFIGYMIAEMNKMRKYRPVVQELFVIAFRDQKIRKMTKKNFQLTIRLFRSIIEAGIKKKEFRKVDPDQVTLAIIDIVESTALFWSLDLIEIDFEKQLRGGIDLILDAIRTRK